MSNFCKDCNEELVLGVNVSEKIQKYTKCRCDVCQKKRWNEYQQRYNHRERRNIDKKTAKLFRKLFGNRIVQQYRIATERGDVETQTRIKEYLHIPNGEAFRTMPQALEAIFASKKPGEKFDFGLIIASGLCLSQECLLVDVIRGLSRQQYMFGYNQEGARNQIRMIDHEIHASWLKYSREYIDKNTLAYFGDLLHELAAYRKTLIFVTFKGRNHWMKLKFIKTLAMNVGKESKAVILGRWAKKSEYQKIFGKALRFAIHSQGAQDAGYYVLDLDQIKEMEGSI